MLLLSGFPDIPNILYNGREGGIGALFSYTEIEPTWLGALRRCEEVWL